ncbi:family AAA domain-containing 2B [Octopus vulgaris]|uniref:Family AAA domain-containing 2B n=1 Tax=Octopus vulgaris TaxID=6645 RepID=A0AA36FG95_OCTVU|nr:family AAA domain-containing 2B [Octopus vulgaris]
MVRTRHSGEALYGFDDLSKIKKKSPNKHDESHVSNKKRTQGSNDDSSTTNQRNNLKRSSTLRRGKVVSGDSSDEFEEEVEFADKSCNKLHMKVKRDERKKSGKTNNKPLLPTRRSTRKRSLLFLSSDVTETNNITLEDDHSNNESHKRKRTNVDEIDDSLEFTDMYSRVKRNRAQRKFTTVLNGMHSTRQNIDDFDECQDNQGDVDEEVDEDDDDADDDSETQEPPRRSYYLREHKPRTKLFEAPPIDSLKKRNKNLPYCDTPASSSHGMHTSYRSPAHRNGNMRRRTAFHGSSSTSSSSDSSDDERRFERRKAKSMTRARNRCLPMNYGNEDLANSLVRDRLRIGSSLADVDPMTVDKRVNFKSIGGLEKHISALKEMIVFPLLYPEVFEQFKITPPRGVLFYGPPGTGKTLVARALANECSTENRRVAFFMRKGADCLSKWVGESERQLRLLFDQAYQTRPSIIFFDEIDGLAPVRSSRQDQIHSSIVSTLLALMDGLDSRDEIVVIGATNRIDAIDPALRRPGRFDREFHFPLPSLQARSQIFSIITKDWNPKLSDAFLEEIAQKCVGYCGADIKALCTEAALMALRRRYPQIYNSSEKLQLDVSSIHISGIDFYRGMKVIVPTAQRSNSTPRHPLSKLVRPLLENIYKKALSILEIIFPSDLSQSHSLTLKGSCEKSAKVDEATDYWLEDEGPCIYEAPRQRGRKPRNFVPEKITESYLDFQSCASKQPLTYRPRLLFAGKIGQGQSVHLAPAIMQHLEQMPVYVIDLPSLYAASNRTPEESCTQIFCEAKRTSPSILYFPHINYLWSVSSETLKATFLTMVDDLDPCLPILLLATSEVPYDFLDDDLKELFDDLAAEVMHMSNPTEQERREFFSDLLLNQAVKPPVNKRQRTRVFEELPRAPPPVPRKLTETELAKLKSHEEATLRELRLFLRDIWNKLAKCRKFAIFMRPVDIEDVPDYYDIVKEPMDLNSMLKKIDNEMYPTAQEFLDDIDLIWRNALEYNPDSDSTGKAIRHRVCALKDMAYAVVNSELNPEFAKMCRDIVNSRKRRGEVNKATNIFSLQPERPDTPPVTQPVATSSNTNSQVNALPSDYPTRFSRRVRGMDAESQAPLEVVEKIFCQSKSPSKSKSYRSNSSSKSQVTSTEAESVECFSEDQLQNSDQSSPVNKSKPGRKLRLRRRRSSASSRHVKNGHSGDDEVSGSEEEQCTKSRSHSSELNNETPSTSKNHTNSEMTTSGSATVSSSSTMQNYPYRTQGHDQAPGRAEQQQSSAITANTTTTNNSAANGSNTSLLSSSSSSSSSSSASTSNVTSSVLLSSTVTSTSVPTSHTTANTTRNGLDSGIGSAIESNGESLDSLDQAKTDNAPTNSQTTEQEKGAAPELADISPLPVENQETEGEAATFQISMVGEDFSGNNNDMEAANTTYNRGLMSKLLDQVVTQTKGYTVERLEKLYSVFSQCIYQQRNNPDKVDLCVNMEQKLVQYTSQHRARVRPSINIT